MRDVSGGFGTTVPPLRNPRAFTPPAGAGAGTAWGVGVQKVRDPLVLGKRRRRRNCARATGSAEWWRKRPARRTPQRETASHAPARAPARRAPRFRWVRDVVTEASKKAESILVLRIVTMAQPPAPGTRAYVLRIGEVFAHKRFGPETVNRGALLFSCEWDGGVFESGVMWGGIFRSGTFRGGVFWGGWWRGGAWERGFWHSGFGHDGRYRTRDDAPVTAPRESRGT